MVSRIFKGAATVVATLSLASAASANCGANMYCGQTSSAQPISSWTGQTDTAYGVNLPGTFQPSRAYSEMSSYQADSTYGTGSVSQTYSDDSTYGFSGSTASVPGLGQNESLQATNCPVNVYNNGEGTVLGCYNVVKPVPQTTYYRVVRPVVYVRYPVPVAVPYSSPCNTVTHYSRYGDFGQRAPRRGCR
jgi:hypothetical protein